MRVNNNENTVGHGITNENLNMLFGPGARRDYLDCDGSAEEAKTECEYFELEKKNEKHFKLTDETIEFKYHTLHRIQCIETFTVDNSLLKEDYNDDELTIKEGELGGYVESEANLDGNAWIQENAKVFGDAKVYDNAVIAGNAVVRDSAEVRGNAIVYDNAIIEDDAEVYGKAIVNGNAKVCGHAEVYSKAKVSGNAKIYNHAKVYGSARIEEYATIDDYARIDNAHIGGDVKIDGNAHVSEIAITGCRAHIANDANICQEYDYMCFDNIGSRKDTLTAYRTKHAGVRITVGCFFGDLNEFRKDVAKKDESEALIKKEYELIADVIQHRFIDHNTDDYLKNNDKIRC